MWRRSLRWAVLVELHLLSQIVALSFFGDDELNISINTFLALVAYASQQPHHSHTKKIMSNFCRKLRSSRLTTSQFPGPNDLRTECFNAHNTTAYNEM
jgi:hypothetical protein